MDIINKIRENYNNSLFWERLKIDPEKVKITRLEKSYTEGQRYFFNKLGKLIPNDSKYYINHISVMVNSDNGEILLFD